MKKVKSNDMIYAVYIPYSLYQPVKLIVYKAEQKENGYECDGSGTVYYILDSKKAIEKYEFERDKRIQLCREFISACEKAVSFMESYDANDILKGDENNG